jgi:hypothetical protein
MLASGELNQAEIGNAARNLIQPFEQAPKVSCERSPPRYFTSIGVSHRLPGAIALTASYAGMRCTLDDLYQEMQFLLILPPRVGEHLGLQTLLCSLHSKR